MTQSAPQKKMAQKTSGQNNSDQNNSDPKNPDQPTRALSEKQKKFLRGLAHDREPIVMIGQHGLSPAVTNELELALSAHEIVKLRARVGDRDARDAIFAELSKQTGSELVQRIGNVAVFYRPKKQPRIVLPDA